MKMYIGYCKEMIEDGACLVFANTARQAKSIAWGVLCDWWDIDWIDVRAKWLQDKTHGYLRACSKSDKPHSIESPPTCSVCELWGSGKLTDSVCVSCWKNSDAERANNV